MKSIGPKLKQHVESREKTGRLNQAINTNDLAGVQQLLAGHPELRQVLVDEVPLQRVAQPGRIPMMDLLVRHGADVNGLAWGWFPALFTPCENLEPEPLQWLLDHGADPNRGNPKGPGTALDYAIQTYPRDPNRLATCIEMLLAAGARTRYNVRGILPILRGRTGELAALLDTDSALLHRRYPELDCGQSGGRLLTLRGATLLHVAVEYGFFDAGRLLLDRGADVNARADIDAKGVGGRRQSFTPKPATPKSVNSSLIEAPTSQSALASPDTTNVPAKFSTFPLQSILRSSRCAKARKPFLYRTPKSSQRVEDRRKGPGQVDKGPEAKLLTTRPQIYQSRYHCKSGQERGDYDSSEQQRQP